MCVNIEVVLPTIHKFLLLYSLRCGSILIYFWTALRTGFCMLFYSTAIIEVLIGVESPFGAWLVKDKPITDNTYIVYYTLLALLMCETVLSVFTLHLAIGVYCLNFRLLHHYLLCRFITWLIEMGALIIMCLTHKLLMGWYLGILFFIILEFYSLIVVYSYYVNQIEDQQEEEKYIC